MTRPVLIALAVLGAGLLTGTAPASAVPLDATACAGLDHERTSLETSGVLADLHMAPDEAKALAKDRLQRVQHYVDVSGQLLFRCGPAGVASAKDAGDKSASAAAPAKTAAPAPAPRRKGALLKRKHQAAN